MNKPVLVVMAAGMGSRYGGMKQIDPVGPNGEVIIDYSLYDAYRAGFRTVIFVNWTSCLQDLKFLKTAKNRGEPAMQSLPQRI